LRIALVNASYSTTAYERLAGAYAGLFGFVCRRARALVVEAQNHKDNEFHAARPAPEAGGQKRAQGMNSRLIPTLFERDSSRSIPRNGAGAHSRFGHKAMIGPDHRGSV
jgi:hypothetical protein